MNFMHDNKKKKSTNILTLRRLVILDQTVICRRIAILIKYIEKLANPYLSVCL